MGDFYVTLPSNTALEGNLTSNYRCPLPHAIELEGAWQVGLAGIHYPSSYINIKDAWIKLSLFTEEQLDLTFMIPDGDYKTIEDLIKAVNFRFKLTRDQLKMMYTNEKKYDKATLIDKEIFILNYKPMRHIVTLETKGECITKIVWSTNLKQLLGMGDDATSFTPPKPNDKIPPILLIGSRVAPLNQILNSLYIYTDIVENQFVGDTLAPLLRIVPLIQSSSEGNIVKEYNNIHYINLLKKSLSSIQITIKTDTGDDFPFVGGKVVVKLHFRKRRLF